MNAATWRLTHGWITSKGQTKRLNRSHLAELERRDLADAGRELSRDYGKPYSTAPTDGRIKGIYERSIERPSGKYAVIERAKDFTLVLWRDVLERQRGKAVSGLIRGEKISWSFGRGRGGS